MILVAGDLFSFTAHSHGIFEFLSYAETTAFLH